MPTKNPRLTITISEDLASQLRQLSRLTGQSQSGLIASLLAESWPVFDRMIDTLYAAERAKAEIQGKLTRDMRQAQQRIEGSIGLELAALAMDEKPSIRETAAASRKGTRKAEREAPSASASNPLSNRGVRSKAKTAKKPAGSRT